MSERKLASIQKILKIEPIEGADQIEKATILGWELVIAKKDNFKVGDLCIYIEVDSILPESNPNFEFLRSRKFRIKTIKLKNQISQGIAFPLNILRENNYWNEGDDVTQLLNIVKYDPQLVEENEQKQRQPKNVIDKYLMKFSWYRRLWKRKKNWPHFIKQTDEPRIQLFPHICENEKDTEFIVTEKLDGQSATYFLKKNEWWRFWNQYTFGVCSRTVYRKTEDNSNYWEIARKYNMKEKLKQVSDILGIKSLYFQGEICGKKIQKNKYNLKENEFFLYNIVDIKTRKKYTNSIIHLVCSEISLNPVPFLDNNFKLKNTISEMVEYSNGKSLINPTVEREGIVVRNYNKNISFKVISPLFLLKHNE